MKSYIQGLITGGVFVFAILVLIGGKKNELDPALLSKLTMAEEQRDKGLGGRYLFMKDGTVSTWVYTRTGVAYHKDESTNPPTYYKSSYSAFQDTITSAVIKNMFKKP